MIRVIAVGNILLSDDGIGIKVCNELKDKILNIDEDIEILIAGTDFLYCLENVNEDDTVIIIDSTYFMLRPGGVIARKFDECDEFIDDGYTSHDESLLKILRRERRGVRGYLIGIEVSSIEYSLDISKVLKRKFNNICSNVLNHIQEIVLRERKGILNSR